MWARFGHARRRRTQEGGAGQESGSYEVRHENGPRRKSWSVFAVLFSMFQCLTRPIPALRPLHDNVNTVGSSHRRGLPYPDVRRHMTTIGGELHPRAAHNGVGSPTTRFDTSRRRKEVFVILWLPTTTWAAQRRGRHRTTTGGDHRTRAAHNDASSPTPRFDSARRRREANAPSATHNDVGSPTRKQATPRQRKEANAEVGHPTAKWAAQR